MNSQNLFIVGTIIWFLIAIGHPVLVDIDLVLGVHSPIGPEVRPDADLRSTLIANTRDFGWLGATTAYRALSGISLWLPTSAFFLGLSNVVIGAEVEFDLQELEDYEVSK